MLRRHAARPGVKSSFDKTNCCGGTRWDAKMRKQIKECALSPFRSFGGTAARLEGYFRSR